MEHDEQAQQMEREADRMEHESERLGEQIDKTRSDWEAKKQDPAVSGAAPDPDEDEDEESAPTEETAAEEGDS